MTNTRWVIYVDIDPRFATSISLPSPLIQILDARLDLFLSLEFGLPLLLVRQLLGRDLLLLSGSLPQAPTLFLGGPLGDLLTEALLEGRDGRPGG